MTETGTANLSGLDLPLDDVARSVAHITLLAAKAKTLGHPGLIDTIRADVFLALLSPELAGADDDTLLAAVLRRAHPDDPTDHRPPTPARHPPNTPPRPSTRPRPTGPARPAAAHGAGPDVEPEQRRRASNGDRTPSPSRGGRRRRPSRGGDGDVGVTPRTRCRRRRSSPSRPAAAKAPARPASNSASGSPPCSESTPNPPACRAGASYTPNSPA